MPTDRNDNIDPALAVNNFLGGVGSTVADIAGKAAASVQAFTNPANLVSNIRSKDLPKDGIAGTRTLTQATTATKP